MKPVISILAVLLSVISLAQNPEQLFADANKLYRQEKYNEALDKYLQIYESGKENAALHYNLGNAYYKTNQIGRAILHYEKAALLDPYDEEIQQNLNLARESSIDRFEEMPQPIVKAAYLALLRLFSPDGWAVTALLALVVLVTGSFLYLFTNYRRPGFILALSGFIAGIFCLILAYTAQSYRQQNQPAIVMAVSSYVKSGPGQKAEDVFILHEGTKVRVTEAYENWRKVSLPDGKVGWMQAEDLEVI